ncbi:aspartate ammonia-lyase [Chitinophaga silvatica]|uniref:Aspartate ammonia-lyase n=1 Tax=Chitinophaga silvatica TaxID=2282649 RepID=A0A3E1Y5Q9_9BACT|nr:aspartate ammonia-lyase [Chitinophaga silvatica]RFS20061.1 aspartate ammonia-lyase [Chitinophaga silvatica]
MNTQEFRIEHDFLGERTIESNVYYGIQTLRAIENFNITGTPVSSEMMLIRALGYVKKAAALANRDLGVLPAHIADAIIYASNKLINGGFKDQFPTDMIQGGAGTSVNMNVNEVIANLGLEYLGHQKGQYEYLHPNNHVNCSQSTNDAYPTALRIALYFKLNEFIESVNILQRSFVFKGSEFAHVLKMGRTQLQDAVPMSLGAEFNAFGTMLREDMQRLREVQALLTEVNMGGTAIGTTINAPSGYPQLVTQYLGELTGLPIVLAEDLVEATSDTGTFTLVSSILKRTAIKISKICNDLRLLSSGPRVGLNEINLPQMQPGSSIMPGKVNPVIPEVVNQTAYYVIGADLTVTMAAEAGQLQLNVMEPVIAFSLFNMLNYLTNACNTLREKCVDGITANEEACREMVMNSVGIVTALNPLLGYETCAAIAKEALKTGKSIHKIVVEEKSYITQQQWDEIYSVENMINPQFLN